VFDGVAATSIKPYPSHLFNSAPQEPTSDAGQTRIARVAVGFPRGPWRSMVHTSASHQGLTFVHFSAQRKHCLWYTPGDVSA
jgi:hypothetical protein